MLTVKFDENTKKLFGEFIKMLKMKNSPAHRWSAIIDVFTRIIIGWQAAGMAFRNQKKSFPIARDKVVIIEFRSIIVPVRNVQTLAQKMKSFVVLDVYLQMCSLYFTVFDATAPLSIHDPTPIPGEAILLKQANGNVQDPVMRPAVDLDPRTTNVRRLLRKALQTRYYNWYHPIRALRVPSSFYGFNRGRRILLMSSIGRHDVYFSHLIDMQTLLCPGFADGVLFKKMIDLTEFDEDDNSLPPGWTKPPLRAQFFKMIMEYCWSNIL